MGHYLIIGATKGVGLSLAKILGNQGHSLTTFSRSVESALNPDEQNSHEPIHMSHFCVDTSSEAPEFPEITDPIDGLVYLPGTVNLKPFSLLKTQDYHNDFQINVIGAIESIKHYLPNLLKSPHASIVLLSSVAASTGFPMHCSIGASKGALIGFMRSLASEYAPKIRVNCVSPSLTITPLTKHLTDTNQKKTMSRKHMF